MPSSLDTRRIGAPLLQFFPVEGNEEIPVEIDFYYVCLFDEVCDDEILASSHESKTNFKANSVLFVVQNLVDKLKELGRSTVVGLASRSKVLNDLFDMSCQEVNCALKRNTRDIFFGAVGYSAIRATAGRVKKYHSIRRNSKKSENRE